MKKVLIAVAGLAMASAAYGQAGTGFTITDSNAVFTQGATTTTAAGSGTSGANFRVTGAAGTDHMFQNTWFYRVDGADPRELAFNNQSGATVVGTNTAMQNFVFPSFSAALHYRVGSLGATAGFIEQILVVTNTTSSPISAALYNYCDMDMLATAGTDTAVLAGANNISISEAGTTASYIGVNANAYSVGTFATARLGLNDADIDNFANTGLNFFGDFTGGWQWNLQIAVGGSATIASYVFIPSPGSAALLGVGGLIAFRRRRA